MPPPSLHTSLNIYAPDLNLSIFGEELKRLFQLFCLNIRDRLYKRRLAQTVGKSDLKLLQHLVGNRTYKFYEINI